MEARWKVILATAMVIVAGAALFFVAKKTGLIGSPPPPQRLLDQKIEKIDVGTFEVLSLKRSEWDELGRGRNGRYRSPKTGKFTMTDVMTCAACKAKIPIWEPPAIDGKEAYSATVLKDAMANYICPKCGKCPFPSQP